jgi:hypothetical protein
MSDKNIAACGLDCAACPAFIAAKTNDDELRKKTLAEWGAAFGFVGKPEDIDCHGCLATDGVQIGHCAECGMRLCALGKGYKNCAPCADYSSCKQLADMFSGCPEAKKNLDAIRA